MSSYIDQPVGYFVGYTTEHEQTNLEQALARHVLRLADIGGMPDSYWQTDTGVTLARNVLGVQEHERYVHTDLWNEES